MKNLFLILAVVSMLFLSGCATGVVSKEFRDEASAGPPVSSLFKNPDRYTGQKVVLGGVIVNSTIAEGKTRIEVIEKPLDYYEKPEFDGLSKGRFIIVHKGYLKRTVYSKGREITVAGEVAGKITHNDKTYLLINSVELHLFKPRRQFEIRLVPGEFRTW
jgi:outer membrane lipoprotein